MSLENVYVLFNTVTNKSEISDSDALNVFSKAYNEDRELTIRALFYGRNPRGGAGVRENFRTFYRAFSVIDPVEAAKYVKYVPEFGRWDDLLYLGGNVEKECLDLYSSALLDGNGLAAKWCPREKSSKRHLARKLKNHMKIGDKEYRKLLVSSTEVLENKMCSSQWQDIEIEKVPSLALTRNTNAISTHVPDLYNEFLRKVENQEVKSNLGKASPIELVRMAKGAKNDLTVTKSFNVYWKALENTIPKDAKVLPVIDVSGSMNTPASGSVTAMDVAVALGMYLSWFNEGPLKRHFLTFHTKPTLMYCNDENPSTMLNMIYRAPWGGSTNFTASLDRLLDFFVSNNVDSQYMPEHLLVFTDMEFNQCVYSYGNSTFKDVNDIYSVMDKKFAQHGYKAPNIIIWNLSQNNGVDFNRVDANGHSVFEFSGFDKSVFNNILENNLQGVSPIDLMVEMLNTKAYNKLFE